MSPHSALSLPPTQGQVRGFPGCQVPSPSYSAWGAGELQLPASQQGCRTLETWTGTLRQRQAVAPLIPGPAGLRGLCPGCRCSREDSIPTPGAPRGHQSHRGLCADAWRLLLAAVRRGTAPQGAHGLLTTSQCPQQPPGARERGRVPGEPRRPPEPRPHRPSPAARAPARRSLRACGWQSRNLQSTCCLS